VRIGREDMAPAAHDEPPTATRRYTRPAALRTAVVSLRLVIWMVAAGGQWDARLEKLRQQLA
jgi:hypothetical protein